MSLRFLPVRSGSRAPYPPPWLRRLGAACCGLAALLPGCRLFDVHRALALRLPEPPGHWQECLPEPSWLIVIPGSGTAVEVRAEPARPPIVLLPKLQHQPVLAFPALPGGDRLPPAAGVFPLDLTADGSTLLLRWERGPAGELLLRLLRQGVDVETLNVARLCREIDDRFALDPWDLDLDAAAAALVSDCFRVTDLRRRPSRTLAMEVGPGRWFLESPFFAPITLPPEPGTPESATVGTSSTCLLTLLDVPLGFHRLFETEAGWVADLWVEEERVLWLPRRLDSPAAGTTQ